MTIARTHCFIFAAFLASGLQAIAATVTAEFSSLNTVPVTAESYTATGNDVSISLSFVPPTGTNLTVVRNTGLSFINGQFDNLAQGQPVILSYNGITYRFVANYFGGTGNDLVLQWAYQDLASWGFTLGNGAQSSNVPVSVTQDGVLAGKTVIDFSAGLGHSLVLCSDGTIAAWGWNAYGQLGDGTNTDSTVPVLVTLSGVLAGKTVVAVEAGFCHSLALCSDGTVAAWGYNYFGQLGDGTRTERPEPVLVNQSGVLVGKTVVAIATDELHSLALCSDGSLVSWGYNSHGQLGANTVEERSTVPVLVSQIGALAGKMVVAVDVGSYHSLALCSDGTLAAWGYGSYGELGNGAASQSSTPLMVTHSGELAGKTVVAISVGKSHSLALCADGTMVAWGRNTRGELGDGTKDDRFVPVLVTQSGALSGKTVIDVSAGYENNLALCSDGTLATWGEGIYGQLGDGADINRTVPVLVNQSGVLAGKTLVAGTAGGQHCLALAAVQNPSFLTSIGVSSGALSPSFSSDVTSYAVSVSNTTTSITLGPTVVDSTATIRVNGTVVNSGASSAAIPLDGGVNVLTLLVTAQDGITSTTYTLTVTRTPSEIATLSALIPSSGSLSPTFSSGITSYSLSVSNTTTSITFTPTVTNATATIRVNGTDVNSGSASQVLPLTLGVNPVRLEVIAPDGITKTNYAVAVTRPLSSVSSLSALIPSTGSLSPSFSSGVTSYAVSIPNTTTSMTLSPTVVDPTATIRVNETSVGSGATSAAITLTVGDNILSVLVTAQDGVTITSYTVIVTRAPSAVATLSGLAISIGSLSPSFSSGVTAYTATVTASDVTVMFTVTDQTATVRLNGMTVLSGETGHIVPLSLGSNALSVGVTAQDGLTISTYTVTVTRVGSYDSWKEAVFTLVQQEDSSISGLQAKPAGDGITNLMKCALGLAPMSSGVGSLPTLASTSGYLTLTYRKSKQATDLTFTVQAGNALDEESWITVSDVVSQTDEGDYWLVTVSDNVQLTNQTSRFMRLKVEIPPVVIDTGNLQILEALYGARGGIADVRSIVEGAIQNDTVNMRVGNVAFGDPSVGNYKSLYIRYQNASGQYETNIRENLMLQIPDPSHTKIQ